MTREEMQAIVTSVAGEHGLELGDVLSITFHIDGYEIEHFLRNKNGNIQVRPDNRNEAWTTFTGARYTE